MPIRWVKGLEAKYMVRHVWVCVCVGEGGARRAHTSFVFVAESLSQAFCGTDNPDPEQRVANMTEFLTSQVFRDWFSTSAPVPFIRAHTRRMSRAGASWDVSWSCFPFHHWLRCMM